LKECFFFFFCDFGLDLDFVFDLVCAQINGNDNGAVVDGAGTSGVDDEVDVERSDNEVGVAMCAVLLLSRFVLMR